MLIGLDEQEKTLDDALGFNTENIFEYFAHLIVQRNGNWWGEKSDNLVKELYSLIKTIPQSEDKMFEIDRLISQALTETSQYAYASGFKEACRLNKTLSSF